MWRIFYLLVFVSELYLFAAWISNLVWSNFYLNPFEDSLRLLMHSWTQKGLVPYRDFYSYYPPGLFLLVGKVLPYTTIIARNVWIGVIVVGLVLMNLFILLRTFNLKGRLLLTLGIYVGLETLTLIYILNDPLILLLVQTIFFASWWYYVRQEKLALAFIFASGALAVWFRWDWPLLLAFSLSGLLAAITLYHRIKKRRLPEGFTIFVHIWKYTTLGVGTGLIGLLTYLKVLGATRYAYELLFIIPIMGDLKHRFVFPALPSSLDDDSFLFFGVIGFIVSSLVIMWRSVRQKNLKLPPWIWLPGLISLLPYGLSYPDSYHMLPVGFIWGSVVLLLFLTARWPSWYLLIFGFLLLPFTQSALKYHPKIPPDTKNMLTQSMRLQLDSCNALVRDASEFRSMFVGRQRYDQIDYPISALYFLNTNIPPATPFIYEDAGVQNTCTYGTVISDNLLHAKKPMLTFLYTGHKNIQEADAEWIVSCGKIEDYLSNAAYQSIGHCIAWGREFEVRVYE